MIQRTVELEISGGQAPYIYQWTKSQNCVQFSQVSGTLGSSTAPTATSTLQTTLTYTDESCLNSTTITLEVTDAQGCVNTKVVNVTNPCSNFTLNSITESAGNVFNVTGTSTECAALSFEWSYNNNIFNQTSLTNGPNSSALDLEYVNGGPTPATTTISVTATDCNGCEKTKNYTKTICIPILEDRTIEMTYNDTGAGSFASPRILLASPTNCSGYSYDWDTVSFSLPTGISANLYHEAVRGTTFPESNRAFFFSGVNTLTAGIYQGTYTVTTSEGITAQTGTLTFIVSGIPKSEVSIFAPDKVWSIPSGTMAGTIIPLNIEDEVTVTGDDTIDWSSWQVVTPPTAASPSITLSTNTNGDHVIQYQTTNPIEDDSFAWVICTDGGACTSSVTYTINSTATAPTANNDTTSLTCGSSVVINVLANDTAGSGVLNTNSVTITTAPTNGTAVVNSGGTITYTAPTGFSGTDPFGYKVSNSSGLQSNEATVTPTVVCSGPNSTISLCN